jgi:hypothetical protein
LFTFVPSAFYRIEFWWKSQKFYSV